MLERSRQHGNGSSGHGKIAPLLAGSWTRWQKRWSEEKGHSVEQGVAGGERRASICAQQKLQRQQILAEQGAHTEEKGMGERPKTQCRIEKKKNQEKSVAYGEGK